MLTPWLSLEISLLFFLFSLEVLFILVDENGLALSGAEALAVLERSDVIARLRGFGYQATRYAAVVPPAEPASAKKGNYAPAIDFMISIGHTECEVRWSIIQR